MFNYWETSKKYYFEKPFKDFKRYGCDLWYFVAIEIKEQWRNYILRRRTWKAVVYRLKKFFHTDRVWCNLYLNGVVLLIHTTDSTIPPCDIPRNVFKFLREYYTNAGKKFPTRFNVIFKSSNIYTCNLGLSSRFFLNTIPVFKKNIVFIEEDLLSMLYSKQYRDYLRSKQKRGKNAG